MQAVRSASVQRSSAPYTSSMYFIASSGWWDYLPSAAACSVRMSSFVIPIRAVITRPAFAGSARSCGSTDGTTCHDTPYRSFSHPH